MKTSIRLPVFALSLLVCVLLLCAHSATGARPQPAAPAQGGGTVIFAVSKYEESVSVEPVVIYRGGKYEVPPVNEEKGNNAFAREYFRSGRKFRIISGGGEAGTLTIIKYQEPGCVGLVADATAETTARLGGRVKALATDSQTLGRGAISRRAPTETERARAVELARTTYTKHSVGASLVSKMEVVNLTATDLDRDGRFELVGSFLAGKNDVGSTSYTLFLIMEPAGSGFKTAWEWFHLGSEDSYEDRHFVDQVDLDGDGVGEVIAMGSYYESNDYIIYKKIQGRWRPVYKGGGGGC